jgi:hypothetical protein
LKASIILFAELYKAIGVLHKTYITYMLNI